MATKGNLGDMEGRFTLNRFAYVPLDEHDFDWSAYDEIEFELAQERCYEFGYGLCPICDGWMPNGWCINERNPHHN